MPLQKLTPAQIQKYYASLVTEKKLSTNTVRKHHDLLNSTLKFAVKQEILVKNPVEKVEVPKFKAPEIAYYNREQFTKLLELSQGDRIELLIHLAGMLGLRREEILGLTWDCVDFSEKKIEVRTVRTQAGNATVKKAPKTQSSRRKLHIPDKILKLLEEERAKQEEYKEVFGSDYDDQGLVIVWEDGRPLRPNYASDLFKKFIEEHGLPYITLHGLRHSFATIANDSGQQLYNIGKALGHSTTATTSKIYTHLLDHGHEEMMESLWGDGNSEI
ncbi:MAG: tyrosine-type recombinase/integrase [Eubacteriales bacterium]